MKVLVIVLCVVLVLVVIGVIIEKVTDIQHRRWQKWFDSLSYDEKRKYQEEMYKLQQMG